jgi:hypothetical protein
MSLTVESTPISWGEELLAQLTGHYEHHVAPRLAGLSDEEYFWEPADGCWSIRPRSQAHAQRVLPRARRRSGRCSAGVL